MKRLLIILFILFPLVGMFDQKQETLKKLSECAQRWKTGACYNQTHKLITWQEFQYINPVAYKLSLAQAEIDQTLMNMPLPIHGNALNMFFVQEALEVLNVNEQVVNQSIHDLLSNKLLCEVNKVITAKPAIRKPISKAKRIEEIRKLLGGRKFKRVHTTESNNTAQ